MEFNLQKYYERIGLELSGSESETEKLDVTLTVVE